MCWPGSARVFHIGVSVRSPHAARYREAAGTAAVAADTAAREKESRYGPSVDVLPFESYGRLGAPGVQLLAELASEAVLYGPLRLGRPVGLRPRQLRTALEAAVLRAHADKVLLSLGVAAGRLTAWTAPRAGGGAPKLDGPRGHRVGLGGGAS